MVLHKKVKAMAPIYLEEPFRVGQLTPLEA